MSNVHVALRAMDLNLLVAFDALARVRSVTRAAEAMGVTQSAMSHTLRRLRDTFDDPLFVREPNGLGLTPRAEALLVPLRAALVGIARALEAPEAFEPRRAARAFRIFSPDLFDDLALPPLLERLQVDAPAVDVAVEPDRARVGDRLATGDLDIAVVPRLLAEAPPGFGVRVPDDLRRRTLTKGGFRAFLRSEHPLTAKRRLGTRAYASQRHVLVSPTGTGPGIVDRFLAERGLERRVAVRVPNFSTALSIVAASDLVLTAPAVLDAFADRYAVTSLTAPIKLPEHAVDMVWHPRFDGDPGHRWFRGLVADVMRSVTA